MPKYKYRIKKIFNTGLLKGLSYYEDTNVKFEVGKKYISCFTGSEYVVIWMEELTC